MDDEKGKDGWPKGRSPRILLKKNAIHSRNRSFLIQDETWDLCDAFGSKLLD